MKNSTKSSSKKSVANTTVNNESEVSVMSKKNEMVVGSKFLMKVKGIISEFEVLEIMDKAVLLRDENGNERKFILTIARSAFNKQDELREELAESDDESDDDDGLDEVLEDDDDADFPPEDIEDEDDEEPAPKPKKESKSKEKKPKKDSGKYWENEEPIMADMIGNEIRYYEEAGKFQIFGKYEKDGSTHIGRGVTIDIGDLSAEDAMRLIANVVYAVKDRVQDDRVKEAVDLLEEVNQEVNPEDYVFSKADLKNKDHATLVRIAKKLGVDIKKNNKTSDTMIAAIIKAQK